MDERGDDEPLHDDGAGVLGVELREPEVVARERRVDDVTGARERPDGGDLERDLGGRLTARRLRDRHHLAEDVDGVLDGGEAQPRHRAVDRAVDDGVEAVVAEGVQPDGEPLHRLLDGADDEEVEQRGDEDGDPAGVRLGDAEERSGEHRVQDGGEPREQEAERERHHE